jgi:DNA repair protein RecO (recombination protein O)
VARSRTYKTEALVLRVVPFAETSQVVHLATPEHGLVAALAKGARRPGADFQGGLSLAMLGEAELAPRRDAELELLRRFRVRRDLRGLASSIERYHAACYVIEILRSWMRPALSNPPLYLAGVTALRAVAGTTGDAVPVWVAWFEARAVAASGHRPHLSSCAVCGEEGGLVFSPAAGGLVHDRCAPEGPRRRLTRRVLDALRFLYTARLSELASEPIAPDALRAIRAVHDLWIPHLLERRPAALAGIPRP